MADEAAERRLPTIQLMDEDLYKATTMKHIRRFRSRIQFLSYSFNELKDLDHVEISAMYVLNMLKYITSLQRHYVPEDIFLWGIMNTDAEGDRLLVKDTRGTPLEKAEGWVGWTLVMKDTNMSLAQLHLKFPQLITLLADLSQGCKLPEEILIASSEPVDYNAARKKVDYKRGRETDQPRSTKWPRAEDNELDFRPQRSIRTCFTQSSQANISMGVTTIQPVPSSGERFELIHTPIGAILVEDLHNNSNEDSSVQPPNVFIPVQAEPIAFHKHSVATDTWKKRYEDQLSKLRELQETNDGLREQLAAKDVEKSDVHAIAQTEVQREREEFKRSMTVKEKDAEETHQQKLAQVQTELEEYKQSSKAMSKRLDEEASRLREALVAKESVVQALVAAHQKEISTLKAPCRKYKTTLDGEIWTNADLHARVQNLEDELNASKYTQERALQAQKSARCRVMDRLVCKGWI
ncbi:hypothetical protein R1flu_011020 [Riccia fluitans]|uniref:Uncharacterized protein n=1 Tax=Riccia fluitans TaxID=41844 RepID=A0ABD1Z6S3_9MARC